jgi:diaminohydroxyphosphoribosylaminopyrimidine deaminase/5-amino-6-(5-phosphoribosylamino)uracil reductase
MKRCIQLAKNGLGSTYPNPLVGSVIVYDGKIIGEGWHQKAGHAHAEVIAIHSVKDKSLLKKATIYVSLEPCSHFGKTPPCCDLIIKHEIPKVIIGTVDPNSIVAGNGIKKLIESGKKITVGILEAECNELNKRFFTFQNEKRPYIILKWAESEDGWMSPKERLEQKPVWITNPYSRQLVHKWRSEEQAILVGTETVVADNPKLNIRDWTGTAPIRIVIDRNNRISKESYIFDDTQKTIVFNTTVCGNERKTHQWITLKNHENLAREIANQLHELKIQSVIIEGGSKTLQIFIDSNLWDEARIFKGTVAFKNGTPAPVLTKIINKKYTILKDELIILRNYD